MPDHAIATRPAHPWVAAGQDTIRFGFGLLGPRADWALLRDRVQRAEALGFDSYWAQDHPIGGVDCWTNLAAMAAATTTIRLGSIVSCIYYRSPALLARIAADVDRLSHGRLILGLGIGDDPAEFAQLALPFPPVRERQHALEEAIRIVQGLWGDTPFTYQGEHFRVQEAQVQPPGQDPHVPLLIAGGGERVTLRQVAQYADMANFGEHVYTGGAVSLADVQRKCAALHHHCAALGRPSATVLRSHIELPLVLADTRAALEAKLAAMPTVRARPSLIAGTPAEVLAYYRALVAAGMQYFIPAIFEHDAETLDLLAREVIPAVIAA